MNLAGFFCENQVMEWFKRERVGTIKPVVGFPNIPGPVTGRNRHFYTSPVPEIEVQGERYAGSVLEVETKKVGVPTRIARSNVPDH